MKSDKRKTKKTELKEVVAKQKDEEEKNLAEIRERQEESKKLNLHNAELSLTNKDLAG